MGRGRGTALQDSKAILYGAIPARAKQDLSREEISANGTVKYYDQLGLVYRIVLPLGIELVDRIALPNDVEYDSGSEAEGNRLEIVGPVDLWVKDGQLHREDGPAVEEAGGVKNYYRKGELHREDGPALIYPGIREEYWLDGELHREGGPALTFKDGRVEYHINGQKHREDGPAVLDGNGNEFWYINDQLHREDGPAAIYPGERQEYWVRGVKLSKGGFKKEWID